MIFQKVKASFVVGYKGLTVSSNAKAYVKQLRQQWRQA